MAKLFFALIIMVFASGCQVIVEPTSTQSSSTRTTTVTVGDTIYIAEKRETRAERRQGLSGRESLGENEAMLFLFDEASILNFWMKDMQFPLDFVWINNGVVVGLSENIPHPAINNGETARIISPATADAVLEINAGQVEQYGINVGDLVQYE